ncbi:OmpA/MotB family protein [Desulfocurvibacter africanus]|uniref:OmpA/MotB domain protein n=1 Tax=Desulfocurvibacter africanus subsp. africanus str. Walvis Bay TaxID=690850 RepID=F3YXS5_DESAF|nr:flagellar motor protein MotB [Desulfocurvibacter africanus]EGJ49519.1 OmpA/MotB domain protein [Desulfocurvibacter africanus subsp. africanus str. Walvis Bay]
MPPRARQRKSGLPPASWMLTFSDLMTLLLTFFVLLLSMSTMDRSYLTRVTIFTSDVSLMTVRAAGRIPTKMQVVIELLENPREAMRKQQRIKDLLFPDDIMPSQVDRALLEENLQILARDEGVALVLSDKLLFAMGEAKLKDSALPILERIAYVLAFMTAPVNVAGHSDMVGGRSDGNYAISANRAMEVLQFLQEYGLDNRRLSVSAFGPDQPLLEGNGPAVWNKNRRVEILVKTTPNIGGYS